MLRIINFSEKREVKGEKPILLVSGEWWVVNRLFQKVGWGAHHNSCLFVAKLYTDIWGKDQYYRRELRA